MIINCERCGSKFNLDENLIKEKGSKVRCSICKNIFMVTPSEPSTPEDISDDDFDDALEETIALDSPPVFDEGMESEREDGEKGDDFDKAFEDALQEDIKDVAVEETPEPEIIPTPPARTKKKNSSRLLVALVIFLILILGALSIYLFAPSLLPDSLSGMQPPKKEDITDTGNRRLDIEGLSGSFLPTDSLGQLYIIRGRIVNNYPQSRSYILIKATIEDDKQNPIDSKLAYAGNLLTESELKTTTVDKLEKAFKNKAGENNSNINVKPKGSVPFMVVFYNLPKNISEFVVETVSSSPGQ